MDPRVAFRLAVIVSGMLLADGRRTASSWFLAGGVQDDCDQFYDCLIHIGKRSCELGLIVLGLYVSVLTCLGGGAVVWLWRWFRRRKET